MKIFCTRSNSFLKLSPVTNTIACCQFSLSHVMEQIVGLMMPLFRGATIFYLPRINTVTIRRAMQKHHITDLGVVPQMLRMFLDTIEYQVEEAGDKWLFDLMLKITPDYQCLCVEEYLISSKSWQQTLCFWSW